MIIDEARRLGLAELREISDAPELDTTRLLLHVLGQPESSYLLAHGGDVVTADQAEKFKELLAERKTGKPLAYILGVAEFYGRDFVVTPDVLIPRPETEGLVVKALEIMEKMSQEKPGQLTVADIGTGSGCIAITLALQSPTLRIIATDISAKALEIAKENAIRHGVLDKIEWLQGDLLEPLEGKKIDLIVSNPPYVPTQELDQSPTPETRGLRFEPRMALDGGEDGLRFVNKIKEFGVPAVLESLNGEIITVNF